MKGGLACGMSNKSKLAEKVVFASKAFRLSKTARFGIVITAILSFLIFAISFYGMHAGNFTFTVDQRSYQVGISLYESLDGSPTSRLVADKVDNADGMTGLCGTEYSTRPLGHHQCIPPDEEVSSVDGPNNGESYIAYTFYVEMKGSSNYVADLQASINLLSSSRGAEEALRVRVIIDGEGTTYAKRQSERGENPGQLEPMTEGFHNYNTVMVQNFMNFSPGQIMKVTVIVWYEGYDADHTIDLWSGGVKLEMNFTVSNYNRLD